MIASLYLFGMVSISTVLAMALPNYADLGRSARINSMQMVAQSLRNISNDAHAEYLLKGSSEVRYVSLERQQIAIQDGFPAASAQGIIAALQLPHDYLPIFNQITGHQTGDSSQSQSSVTIQYRQARANCWVLYQEANTKLSQYTPQIKMETRGC